MRQCDICEGTGTTKAYIGPVFNIRGFPEKMGVVVSWGVSVDRKIHSGTIVLSFDARFKFNNFYEDRFELNNFYEDQKDVGVRSSISHR